MSSAINEIDAEVLASLTARDRLKALLKRRRGWSIKRAAKEMNEYAGDVSKVMAGQLPGSEIRDGLAEILGLTRAELDRIIDGPETTTGVVAPEPAS